MCLGIHQAGRSFDSVSSLIQVYIVQKISSPPLLLYEFVPRLSSIYFSLLDRILLSRTFFLVNVYTILFANPL
jgi:hypothetical protein